MRPQPATSPTLELEAFNCHEVWGGNESHHKQIARPGLDLWIWSRNQGVQAGGGGDVHFVSSCASGRITRTVLADICAEGSMFGETARQFAALLKQNVNRIGQSRVVAQIGRLLNDGAEQGVFTSVLTTTFFAPSRTLSLCNADYAPPFRFRAEQQEWSVLTSQQPSADFISASPHNVQPSDYQEFATKLQDGDMLLAYSNSFADCIGPNGRTLGVTGLLNLVRDLNADSVETLTTELTTLLENAHPNNFVDTDSTLLLYRATPRRVGWRDNLMAPLRLIKGATDAIQVHSF